MFLNPLGLLALGAVPLVVLLHLYRRRFRPHVVSALFLWTAEDRVALAGRRRERLRTSTSFWCEVAAALCLALAFAGPRFFGAGRAQHLVVVLDSSASMGALAGSGSLAERARARVHEHMEQLGPGSRVTLIGSGKRPEVLVGPAAFPAEARAALAAWQPGKPQHALEPALSLALQLSGAGSVLLVSDRVSTANWPKEVGVAAVGEALPNLALTHASRRRASADSGEPKDRLDLAVHNFSSLPAETLLTLSVEQGILEERRVALQAGERALASFLVPREAPLVTARIPADALAIDNVAFLAPAPPRTLAITSTLTSAEAQTLGLREPSDESSLIGRLLAIVPDAIEVESVTTAHWVLAQGTPPAECDWCLLLHTPAAPTEAWIGPFLADRRHPLLEGTTLEGCVWSGSPNTLLPGVPLVSAGSHVLLSEEERAGASIFHLQLGLKDSTLQHSPDWPILLCNLAEMRRASLPGPARTSLALGENFRYYARAPASYRLRGETGVREIRANSVLEIDDIERPGAYQLESEGRELCRLGISFCDATESDLQQLESGERTAQAVLASMHTAFSWLEALLISLAVAAILLDWYVLARAHSRSGEEILWRPSQVEQS